MKLAWTALGGFAAALAPALVGIAQDSSAPATRVATIPAHEALVENERVCEPAVMGERQVPIYETVKVPVVETRCVPVLQKVEEPVYATREVQAFEDHQVPVTGPVEVPVYESKKKPVKIEFTNPFTCRPVSWHLWDRCEYVCAGTRTEQGVVGYRTEQTPVTRTETYVSGTRTREVQVGQRSETVTVGTRDEQRCVGFKSEPYVMRPAVTQHVRERVNVPAETVTVVTAPDATGVAPSPGTSRVLTEKEFQDALASASASPAPPSPVSPAPAGPAAPPAPAPLAPAPPFPPSLPAAPDSGPGATSPAPAPSPNDAPLKSDSK